LIEDQNAAAYMQLCFVQAKNKHTINGWHSPLMHDLRSSAGSSAVLPNHVSVSSNICTHTPVCYQIITKGKSPKNALQPDFNAYAHVQE
jgi:hypothetical protein